MELNNDPERLKRLADLEDGCPIQVGGLAKRASAVVGQLERDFEALRRRVWDVEAFVRDIGPKDPRSSGFIAERVRVFLGIKYKAVE
jgi:hypothetical protein